MFNFFPQLIIVLAVSVILVIIIRKLPALGRQEQTPKEEEISFRGRWEILRRGLNYSIKELGGNIEILKQKKYFKGFWKFLEKLLRKIRVLFLKIDYKISEWIERLKKAQDVAEEKKWIKIIVSDPRNIEAYKNLGEFYFQHKAYGKAEESFKKVLALNPHNEQVTERLKELKTLKEQSPM